MDREIEPMDGGREREGRESGVRGKGENREETVGAGGMER